MRAMRAERFGSYSMPITSAATPRLRRLKSILRYFCLWPPPMWREVSRPKLLRPPVFFFGSTRLLAGCHFVISSKAGSDLKRSVGVSGRKFFSAILNQVDLLAFLQRDDRLLPICFATKRAAHPRPFSRIVAGVNIDNLLLEQALNRVFDLDLVRARMDPENVLV